MQHIRLKRFMASRSNYVKMTLDLRMIVQTMQILAPKAVR